MLPPLASIAELSTALGEPVGDTARAAFLLSAASTLVRTHTGRIWVDADGWEASATPLQRDAVTTVTLMVAERVWRNPSYATQESSGPFAHTVASLASMGLVLSDTERAMLRPQSGGEINGLSTIRLVVHPEAAGVPRTVIGETDE